MELLVLDTNFKTIAVIDTFESVIWTDRYCKCGDFEIYTSINSHDLAVLQEDNYLWSRDSEHLMIIDQLEITTDTENGKHLTVTGQSLEFIFRSTNYFKTNNIKRKFSRSHTTVAQ